MRREYILLMRKVPEKLLRLTGDKENALSRTGACAKWKYLLACDLGRELWQVGTECRPRDEQGYSFLDLKWFLV
jgi:hypothetical protein